MEAGSTLRGPLLGFRWMLVQWWPLGAAERARLECRVMEGLDVRGVTRVPDHSRTCVGAR